MDNHRFLENKFKEEIAFHLKKAIPNLYEEHIKFRQADSYEDGNLCFDLEVNLNFTVSVRIRKNRYSRFDDLTIRSKAKQGGKTEIDKIKEGMAQIYFYAYMNEEGSALEKVRISNVDAIRKLYGKEKYDGPRKNPDGTELIAFKFSDIKHEGGEIYKYN